MSRCRVKSFMHLVKIIRQTFSNQDIAHTVWVRERPSKNLIGAVVKLTTLDASLSRNIAKRIKIRAKAFSFRAVCIKKKLFTTP